MKTLPSWNLFTMRMLGLSRGKLDTIYNDQTYHSLPVPRWYHVFEDNVAAAGELADELHELDRVKKIDRLASRTRDA